MRKYFIFFCVIYLFLYINSVFAQQGFKIIDYDFTKYPEITSYFYQFDNQGVPVKNLTTSDFVVRDNGLNVSNLQSVECSNDNLNSQLSVTLCFDLALSNFGGAAGNFETGRRLAKVIAARMMTGEVSLTSFDIRTYLNREFTDTLSQIVSEINQFKPSDGSLFDVPFLNEPAGAFKIVERGKYKKVIVFITDCSGSIKDDEILNLAKSNDVVIYSLVIGKKAPEKLINLSRSTGGWCLDNIEFSSDFNLIANIIRAHALGHKPCILKWTNDYSCLDEHKIDVIIPAKNLRDSIDFNFQNLNKSLLDADPRFIGFSSVDIGKSKKLSLTLTAKNKDVFIKSISIKEPFKITEGNVTDFNLTQNSNLNITIEYTPLDSFIVFAELIVESDVCIQTPVYITGGFPNIRPKEKTIKVIHPNGGEVLIIGDTTSVDWIGLLPKDVVQIEYSTDNGKKWKFLAKNADGLKTKWTVPDEKSDSCLVKIIQLWPNNFGQTLSLKHHNSVNSAFFNSEGDLVITASSDTTAIVWNANTGLEKFILRGHSKPVTWAQFAPGEKYVATASADSTIKIWSLADGSLVKTLTEHKASVNSVSWCHAGLYMVSCDYRGTIVVWDTNWTIQNKIQQDPNRPVWFSCFNPVNPELIVTATNDGKARVWNWKTYTPGAKEEQIYNTNSIDCRHVTFNTDGTKIAAATSSAEPKRVFVWETTNPSVPLYSITHNTDTVSNSSINFSSFFLHPEKGKEVIMTSCTDQTARLWDASDGSPEPFIVSNVLSEHKNSVSTAVFDRFGTRVLTASWDSTAKIWNSNQKELQQDLSDSLFRIDYAKGLAKDITFRETALGDLQDTMVTATFKNMSNFDYNIQNISIEGLNKDDFSINDELKLPVKIKAGDSLNIEFRFLPRDYGVRTADLVFKIPASTLKSKLEGICFEQVLFPNNPIVDYHLVRIGNFKDTTFSAIVTNRSSQPVKINKVEMVGSYRDDFSIKRGDDTVIVQPGSDHLMSVRFNPEDLGRKNAQISINYNDKGTPTIINLFGEGIISTIDSATIYIDNASGEPGETVSVPIKVKNIGSYGFPSNVEGFYTYLKFNSTLLEPIGTFDEDVVKDYERRIKISLPKTFGADSVLRRIEFKVGFGNDTISPLTLEYTHPIGLGNIVLNEESGSFKINNLCFDGGIRLFDPIGRLSLAQNIPNPVTDVTKINFEIIENGMTKLYITDILGNQVVELINQDLREAKYEMTLNLSTLPQGNYNYVLKTPTQILIKNLQRINK